MAVKNPRAHAPARALKYARVRVLTSFNGMRRGDEADVELNPRVQGWVNAGLVEVIGSGTGAAGPGGAEPDDHQRDAVRASGSGASGGEPGEGFGTGGYGTAEGFDQS